MGERGGGSFVPKAEVGDLRDVVIKIGDAYNRNIMPKLFLGLFVLIWSSTAGINTDQGQLGEGELISTVSSHVLVRHQGKPGTLRWELTQRPQRNTNYLLGCSPWLVLPAFSYSPGPSA